MITASDCCAVEDRVELQAIVSQSLVGMKLEKDAGVSTYAWLRDNAPTHDIRISERAARGDVADKDRSFDCRLRGA